MACGPHCPVPVCRPADLTLARLLHRLLHALALFIGLRLCLGIFHLRRCLLAIAAPLAGLRARLRLVRLLPGLALLPWLWLALPRVLLPLLRLLSLRILLALGTVLLFLRRRLLILALAATGLPALACSIDHGAVGHASAMPGCSASARS